MSAKSLGWKHNVTVSHTSAAHSTACHLSRHNAPFFMIRHPDWTSIRVEGDVTTFHHKSNILSYLNVTGATNLHPCTGLLCHAVPLTNTAPHQQVSCQTGIIPPCFAPCLLVQEMSLVTVLLVY